MIEVFKTDVDDSRFADILVEHIQLTFQGYEANFDLQDRDKILRVKNVTGRVNSERLIKMLNTFGFYAEVLPDNYPPISIGAGVFILDLNHHSILN